MYDYGDEAQWDDVATEGVDWLPHRIFGSQGEEGCRVVVIHSTQPTTTTPPDVPMSEREVRLDDDEEAVRQQPDETCRMLGDQSTILAPPIRDQTTDRDYLYGMQLLLGCVRGSATNNGDVSLYKKIFNARYDKYVLFLTSIFAYYQ